VKKRGTGRRRGLGVPVPGNRVGGRLGGGGAGGASTASRGRVGDCAPGRGHERELVPSAPPPRWVRPLADWELVKLRGMGFEPIVFEDAPYWFWRDLRKLLRFLCGFSLAVTQSEIRTAAAFASAIEYRLRWPRRTPWPRGEQLLLSLP
jgi:hypothetical protein